MRAFTIAEGVSEGSAEGAYPGFGPVPAQGSGASMEYSARRSPRPLSVHTARLTYAGADRFDVTRPAADAYSKRTGAAWEGEPFAPSWTILRPALNALHAAKGLSPVMLRASTRSWWEDYVRAYTHEMRQSYRRHPEAWAAVLARREVTLVCYCADPERCHRTVLAGILAKLGANVRGER